jgi:LysM repeat protein
VQNGDYLAKVSRKFNVTIAAIKNANGLKSDVIRIGQKLKIPGANASAAPAVTAAQPAKLAKSVAAKTTAKTVQPYSGATKEYVVKSGDTLGAIAYGSGINIRQLKALNSLTSDSLKVGQKLKIPAVAAKKESAAATKPVKAQEEVKKEEDKPVVAEATTTPQPPASVVEEKKADEVVAPQSPAPVTQEGASSKAEATFNYTVSEGEDITGVTIRWGVSAAKIRELNNLAEDAQLKPGQVIKLPAEVQQ